MTQDNEGKSSRKSDKIAMTPTRGTAAEVTPRPANTEREQGNAKKAKQTRKKGLQDYFSAGARVPAPSLDGTPTDTAVQRRRGGNNSGTRNNNSDQLGGNSLPGYTKEDNQQPKRKPMKSHPKGSDNELS